jgi:hypothetical protein
MYYSLSFNYRRWEALQHKALTWRDFMHARIEAQDRIGSLLPVVARSRVRRDLSAEPLGSVGVTVFPDRSVGREEGLAELRKRIANFVDPNSELDQLRGIRPGDPALASTDSLDGRGAFLSAVAHVQAKRFAESRQGPSQINSDRGAVSHPFQLALRLGMILKMP